MSRRSSVAGSPVPLNFDVLKAEEDSLQTSAIIDNNSIHPKSIVSFQTENPNPELIADPCICCLKSKKESAKPKKPEIDPEAFEKILFEKEKQLREEFDEQMEKTIGLLKDRFDFILQ